MKNSLRCGPEIKRKFITRFKEQKYLHFLIWPGLINLLVFAYIPMVGVVLAFTQYNIAHGFSLGEWVGLNNFLEFFKDRNFFRSIYNTVSISLLRMIISFPLPIIFAICLNELYNLKFKKMIQTISYLPHFLSWVILSGFLMEWTGSNGGITKVLHFFNIIPELAPLLGEPGYFWAIAIASDIWKELGFSSIIYIAAITSIDPSQYEAAIIDGAGRWGRIRYVTLPGIAGVVTVMLVLSAGYLLNTNFDQFLTLRNAMTYNVSLTLDLFVYDTGISMARFSYATAVGLFRSIVAMLLLLGANFATKKIGDRSLY